MLMYTDSILVYRSFLYHTHLLGVLREYWNFDGPRFPITPMEHSFVYFILLLACFKIVISTSPSLLRNYLHFVRERLPWQIIYGKCLTYNIACPHIFDMSHTTLSCYFQRCWPMFTQDLTLSLSVSSYIFVQLIMGIFSTSRKQHYNPYPVCNPFAAGANSSFLRTISEDTSFFEDWPRSTFGTIIIQDVDQY